MKDAILTFKNAILNNDRIKAHELVIKKNKDSIGHNPVEEIIVPALEEIGDSWVNGDVALSQVYMSGRICEELVESFFPAEPGLSDSLARSSCAIALLKDHHTLGKQIIVSALRASGIAIQDLGRVEADELITMVIDRGIRILLISVLMLPSALAIKEITSSLAQAGTDIKVVVGGAPFRFDQELWQEVGADATGANVTQAIKIVKQLLEEES